MNAKQPYNHSALPKFHTSASGYAKVLIFFLFARFHQSINNRPHWYSLFLCLLHYPFPRLFADSPTDRNGLFAESFAPRALAFTAPVVFVLIHHISRLIVSPFCAVSRLDYLALVFVSLACLRANVALLHIKYKVVASPALYEIKFLLHIISFNKGGCPPLLH